MWLGSAVKMVVSVVLVAGLAACTGTFRTSYVNPAPAKDWRVAAVNVSVPSSLTVSEQDTLLPKADILWLEDPRGDRYEQVATIMRDAIRKGASGLGGSRPVVLDVTMTRFHAMTWRAETLSSGGVDDVEFDMVVRDARTSEVIYGPEHIEASFPAMTGSAMASARMRGETQKSQITAHVARTIAGWLGVGPDARGSFNSIGG